MKLLGVVFFWVFKDCLRIFVMVVNVDICKTVLIAGESTDSPAFFIELLKFFCEVLFLGCMRTPGVVSGAQLEERRRVYITASGYILANGNISLNLFMAPLRRRWYVVAEHHIAQL